MSFIKRREGQLSFLFFLLLFLFLRTVIVSMLWIITSLGLRKKINLLTAIYDINVINIFIEKSEATLVKHKKTAKLKILRKKENNTKSTALFIYLF